MGLADEGQAGGLPIERDVPLGPLTTLQVGGRAKFLARPTDPQTLYACLQWGREAGLPVWIFGGGSNVVIAEQGFAGLVVQYGASTCSIIGEEDAEVRVSVGAGHDWDAFVAWSVDKGLAGLECLSGIPGRVGAAPIQNIGAYGQECSETFVSALVLDLHALGLGVSSEHTPAQLATLDDALSVWDAKQCDFGYRQSAFKRAQGRYVVLEVTFALRRGGAPTIRYPELARALAASGDSSSLKQARETVIALRRRKSMVLDPNDPNSRSAGSFFMNPIVTPALADQAWECLKGRLGEGESMPRYEAGEGLVKLSAAWLIERCGLPKGCGFGPVGLSQKHTLAIINRGGATACELLGFACCVQRRVEEVCGILLHQEPILVGFGTSELAVFEAPSYEALDGLPVVG